jgi:hypothetical protein
MPDFSQLVVQKTDTAVFTFWDLVGEPKLVVRSATESNKKYFNEMLRRAEHLAKRKAKVSVELIQEDRNRDRDLYAEYVIIGFGDNVVDAKGEKVLFSKENLKAFLALIPDEQFDDLRKFCRDESNFRKINEGAAAGNSQTA